MKRKKLTLLTVSYVVIAFTGFALGIDSLPLLTAPASPSNEALEKASKGATFTTRFVEDLEDSDFLHWGEGIVYISDNQIAFQGKLAPGPDYKLYLSPEFVETEDDFLRLKHRMVRVGNVDTFNHFVVPVTNNVNPKQYSSVIVWCEAFGQFITSARYQ
jgi:hypothetical protein